MDKIEFREIHNVVIDFLKGGSNSNLETIGLWYFRFLKSDKEKLALHLPYYSQEFSKTAFDYIRVFTLVFNLLKVKKLMEFEGTCLFDIFNESSNAKNNELTLDFLTQKQNLALWGDDTITQLDTFLPVFNKEQIIQLNKPKIIKNTFELFKSIRKSGIIDFPILIQLDETLLSFNNIGNIDNEFVSENIFFVESIIDDDSAIKIEDQLIAQKFRNSLIIKYPYSKKPHPYLIDIAKKKFNLVFSNRFAYNEISENDLFLLKDETNITPKIKYSIINTNHSKNLYYLFKSFREQWTQLELNKFTTPFPKYWLLFLNDSLTKEEWFEQFKKDFPAIAERPIINTIEKVIEEVIGLNWIEKEISDSTKILFPELKSNRKKRLESILNNFKNYITTINSNVEFINTMDSINYGNVLVLDSFNIIDLVNKNQSCIGETINVTVPDFIYFGYQPWIKFHLFSYQFTPLLNGMRDVLDDNYNTNKEELEKIKTGIIKEIKTDLKNYRNKYEEVIEEEKPNLNDIVEDLEFTNAEEIEVFKAEVEHASTMLIINENLTLPANEKILLQRNSLFYIKASAILVGDYMLRNSDISELYKTNDLFDKLVNYPQEVLNYQNRLFKRENAHSILINKGLSIETQSHFKNKYLIEKQLIKPSIIPKRKKDWAIICEFLNINHSDQHLSFIAYYGRRKQNELKQMYKTIIELLLENSWIGTIEDSLILNSVSQIVSQHNAIFKTTDSTEIKEISESIISTILNQLKLTEVKTIRYE